MRTPDKLAQIKASYVHSVYTHTSLSVCLGDTLDLILLLDGIRVGRALGSVDQLIGLDILSGFR
jgi:hypothetical protein